ncbi:MAG: long-chain fatty acid--CoA ligase [Alphaproteobacteria bacterium]|nr:long-chain fatty acid--CoA ligase [Alphaproteobacteria bacterium]
MGETLGRAERYDAWPNLAVMFFEQAALLGSKPFVWSKIGGAWQAFTWTEAANQVATLARAIRALGIAPGDRVVLVSESRREWPLADLAIMAAGAITVPAYTTNQVGDHLHIIRNSGARLAIVSSQALADRLLPAVREAGGVAAVIAIEPVRAGGDHPTPVHAWSDLIATHRVEPAEIAAEVTRYRRTDTACLIYTSGTGGVPKGVMLSHGALLSNCKGAYDLLEALGLGDEVFLSFLPLSHSYEHTAGLLFPITIGAQIYYAEGVDKLAPNMVEVRPTIMTAVPRLYETMRERMLRTARQAGGFKETLFHRAVELGRARYAAKGKLPIGSQLLDAVLDVLVRNNVRARFGGRLKALVSGGAPLNVDVGLFFTALGLRLLQGYGQTESSPIVSCNRPQGMRIETVGPAFVDVEVRIADDGEILVRGELVMQGYWNDAKASAEVLRDGWLHTGDIGTIDADGHIRITDRKKDIIVNSGGDNVSPQRVEGFLTLQPEIAQAMVYGDKRPHLVALIVPRKEFADGWAAAQGKSADLATLIDDPGFRAAIGAAIERVNADLSVIERVRRFVLTAEEFTVANAMMTPSLKIRRHAIKAVHAPALEALYGDHGRAPQPAKEMGDARA